MRTFQLHPSSQRFIIISWISNKIFPVSSFHHLCLSTFNEYVSLIIREYQTWCSTFRCRDGIRKKYCWRGFRFAAGGRRIAALQWNAPSFPPKVSFCPYDRLPLPFPRHSHHAIRGISPSIIPVFVKLFSSVGQGRIKTLRALGPKYFVGPTASLFCKHTRIHKTGNNPNHFSLFSWDRL